LILLQPKDTKICLHFIDYQILIVYISFTLNQKFYLFLYRTHVKLHIMAYWLVKSEPSTYGWDQLEKDKKTSWDGVRNFAARNHLKEMKKDDEVLFYHSNEGMEIVGIAKVIKESYQDPTTDDVNWVVVDLKPFKKLKQPVSLLQIKSDKRLTDMALVRLGRLSVQPVTESEWKIVMEMAGEK
jgi:predicted RNA-binding protein with PUA-like domain